MSFNVALLLIITMETPLKRDYYHLYLVNFAKPNKPTYHPNLLYK